MSNSNNNINNTRYEDPVELIRCDQCGVLVPRMNWQIHQIHACSVAVGGTTNTTLAAAAAAAGAWQPQHHPRGTIHKDEDAYKAPPPTLSTAVVASRKPNSQQSPEYDDRKRPARRPSERNDVVDLMDDDDSIVELIMAPQFAQQSSSSLTAAAAAARAVTTVATLREEDVNNTRHIWACPRCTLHNPIHARCCHACGHHQQQQQQQHQQPNNDFVRSPDPVRRRERLMDECWSPNANTGTNPSSSSSSPLLTSYLSGGALLGGVIGATGAYLQGRPVATSAMNGMVGGAVGGAIWSEFFGSSSPPRQPPPLSSSVASAATRVHNPYLRRRTTEPTARRGRGRSRGSRRHNYTTTGASAHRDIDNDDNDEDYDTDPLLLEFLLRSESGLRHRPYPHGGFGPTHRGMTMMNNLQSHMDVDRMSYEQLLARFGNGSDHWGADPHDVARLPVTTLHHPATELPEDGRDCSICLEAYRANDQRKVLPCWHGYHTQCIDPWLLTNGSCPICKHKISINSSTPS